MSSPQTSQQSCPLSALDVLGLQQTMTETAVNSLFWGISAAFSLVALYIIL